MEVGAGWTAVQLVKDSSWMTGGTVGKCPAEILTIDNPPANYKTEKVIY
jgi:hypothetical protein